MVLSKATIITEDNETVHHCSDVISRLIRVKFAVLYIFFEYIFIYKLTYKRVIF